MGYQNTVKIYQLFIFLVALGFFSLVGHTTAFAQSVAFNATSYTTNDAIAVTWTAATNRSSTEDWVGLYRVGASDRQFISWQYIPDGQGSGTLTFPRQAAGQYEARMFVNDGYERVGVSNRILVSTNTAPTTGSYSITGVSATYTTNQVVRLTWTAPLPRATTEDWVGLYRVGASDRQFISWQYIPDGQGSGSQNFTPPGPGDYEFRMFTEDGFTEVARSNRFSVGAVAGETSDTYTVRVGATSYTTNDAIAVTWTAATNRSSTEDWVGLYRVGASDRQFISWQYIPDGQGSGTLTFPRQAAGQYEARMFVNDGYERVGVSQRFQITAASGPDNPGTGDGTYQVTITPAQLEVGQTVEARWQVTAGNAGARDWVGLYRTDATDRQFISWQYVSSRTSGSVTFTPPSPGRYEIRYFKNNGYTKVATSGVAVVSGATAAQCPVPNLNAITNYPPRNGPVIAFGDSLTAGVGASSGQSFPEQLARKSGLTIVNAGRSGDTTRDALNRLNSDVLARDPSVVIVWLGGNDILQRYYERVQEGAENPNLSDSIRLLILRITGKLPDAQGITEAETFANLRQIIEQIQADGAVVIVVGFSGGVFDANLEQRYASVANQTGAIYVPNALGGIIGRPSLMSDLVHPNNTGYGLVADRVLPYLACTVTS
jgi:acyl-CoA thioesterase I